MLREPEEPRPRLAESGRFGLRSEPATGGSEQCHYLDEPSLAKQLHADIRFSPCGEFVVDASWSGFIRVRRVQDLSVVEQYSFPGEMMTSVSANADAGLWLFAHQPKVLPGAQFAAPPYLTLWEWPLRRPIRTLPCDGAHLHAVQLAPSGRRIAALSSKGQRDELLLLEPDGKISGSAEISIGGSGSKVRWSSDSRRLGAVTARAFQIFQADSLKMELCLPDQYPADVAFISENSELLLGSWNGGRVVTLQHEYS